MTSVETLIKVTEVNREVSFEGPFLVIICEQNDELKFETLIQKYIAEFYIIFRGEAGNQLVARLKKRPRKKAS